MQPAYLAAKPLRRIEGLKSEYVDGELLIYDTDAFRVHCLNGPAALVFDYCDGRNTVAEMTSLLGRDTGTTCDDRLVLWALTQLSERSLLAEPLELPAAPATTRRSLLKLGGAALALPVVTSILAPTAAAAISNGSSSGSSGQSGSNGSSS